MMWRIFVGLTWGMWRGWSLGCLLSCIMRAGCGDAWQRIVKGPARIVVNLINHTTKLGIGIGSINICDGDSYTRVTLDIVVFLAIGCMRELHMFTIPQKPHGG